MLQLRERNGFDRNDEKRNPTEHQDKFVTDRRHSEIQKNYKVQNGNARRAKK